nr:hypothetical protein [uncultured Olsenella sp.]
MSVPKALSSLLDMAVWVAWDGSSGRKVPKSPRGGVAAVNDPYTWGTYEEALAAAESNGYSGVGIMLTGGLVGIDLDGAVSEDGEVLPWAREIIDGVDSYTEVSPSGTGVHVLAYASPEDAGAIGRADHERGLEVYNHGRYFTVTGRQIGTQDVAERTPQVMRLVAERFPGQSPETRVREAVRGIARDQVRRMANSTMRYNAARDGRRYARVPLGGETCGFCTMLASRGFVYRSAKTAGEGNHYHSDCRCKVIPGFEGMTVEGYDPGEYARRYYESLQLTPRGSVDIRATVRAMDRRNYHVIRESRNARRRELYAMGKVPARAAEDLTLRGWKDDAVKTAVNLVDVESKSYAVAVRSAFGGEPVGDVAVDDARRILRHRSGTLREDLYLYDVTDGRRLDSVTDSKGKQEVTASERMVRRARQAVGEGHGIAFMHNHPGSSMPSVADFESLRKSGASFGVIACHDGTIYRYSVVGEPLPGYDLNDDSLMAAVLKRIANGKSEREALKSIEDGWGVRIEHIRQGEG